MTSNLDSLDDFADKNAATIRFRRPMVDVLTASAALDKRRAEVMALIESGEIRWAWNLSPARDASNVRILSKSLEEYQASAPVQHPSEAEEFRAVMRLILPSITARPGIVAMVRACELAERLSVDVQTIGRLIGAGALAIGKAVRTHSGINSSPAIKVASVEAFLKARRIA